MQGRLLLAATLGLGACSNEPTPPLTPGGGNDGGVIAGADGGQPAKDAGAPAGRDAATGGEDAAAPGPDSGLPYYTWWQDVEPIVRNKCQLCHTNPPQFGAPRPFVDYEDTQALIGTTPVHEVMVFRIFADQNRMPPASQPQLTDDEKRIIRTWSEIGAPEGEPPGSVDAGTPDTGAPDAGSTGGDAGVGRPISRTLEIRAVEPGTTNPAVLPVNDTSYLCWSFDVPAGMSAEEYAFRFEPILDNTANTHHMLLFHDDDAGNDPGPFDCAGLPLEWNMIAGWAPGRMPDEIPAGAGVRIQEGEQLVLQVHYDNVTQPGTTDNSGMRVLLTDQAGLTPAGILWSGVIWGSSINGSNVSRTHTCDINQAVTMFTVFPHMHQVGKRITMEVQRAGQSGWTTLVDVSGWSFEDQPNVPIPPAEQTFMPGDKVRTTCWWDTQGQSVGFGEASDDEMCFNFIYHYPKIGFEFACVGLSP